ncbi:MAG: C10 family peptidase [Bacteroidales bacterium]|nr:C10 family peptidase [Bacteroidales bacterium]
MLWYSFIAKELYNKRSSLQISDYAIHNSWSKLGDGEFISSQTKSGFLLGTRWGQGCFYNTQCPNDLNIPCLHTVTGCVATAMAQIMKHWNFPQFGTGTFPKVLESDYIRIYSFNTTQFCLTSTITSHYLIMAYGKQYL